MLENDAMDIFKPFVLFSCLLLGYAYLCSLIYYKTQLHNRISYRVYRTIIYSGAFLITALCVSYFDELIAFVSKF